MAKTEYFLVPLDYEGEWKPVRIAFADASRAARHDALLPGHLGFRVVEKTGASEISKSYLFAQHILIQTPDKVLFQTERGRNWLDGENNKRYGLITREGTILRPV